MTSEKMIITPENRAWFESMGFERVRIDLTRGIHIHKGTDREQALEWISEQEHKQKKCAAWRDGLLLLLTAIAAQCYASEATKIYAIVSLLHCGPLRPREISK
jgi:hypothetical protein